jgi:hypothetical protein
MFSNRLAVAGVALACVCAAAAGGYLANRQNAVPAPASAQEQPAGQPAGAAGAALTAEKPVQETEALVGDAPKAAPAAPAAPIASTRSAASAAPAPAPARPARRVESTQASRTSTPATRSERTVTARHEPPPLAGTWPSSQSGQQPPSSAQPPAPPVDPVLPRNDERVQEPARAPEPPPKQFEELTVSADSVLGLSIENRLSSETAKVEDKVEAKVTRDVRVGDRVAIPAGSRALGSVMLVERGGKFKERARLGIRFHTLVLADGTRVPISTETIYREGDAPGNSSAAKVGGGAVGGAILGAILGGGKGAAIGATVGAGGGTAAVMAGDRSSVTVPVGTPITARILSPVTITTQKDEQ